MGMKHDTGFVVIHVVKNIGEKYLSPCERPEKMYAEYPDRLDTVCRIAYSGKTCHLPG